MTKLPITLCLFTSTRGHFERKLIYQRTVTDLLNQVPKDYWAALRANIKVEDKDRAYEMEDWLKSHGFEVTAPKGDWKHGDESHQTEYLKDIFYVVSTTASPYILFMEDDWLIKSENLTDWLARAIQTLDERPEVVQVRIPRYSNEAQRIEGLRAKHGIDALVVPDPDNDRFLHNDWSNNPYIARTRDLNAAIRFVMATNLPRHTEHGLGRAMKMLSSSPAPFMCFEPEVARCGHIGTLAGEEDNLEQPLNAT